jgi:hypothetical protein
VGISDLISVGAEYDKKKNPRATKTFMRRAYDGLKGENMPHAIATIDAWYKAHPDELTITAKEIALLN